MYPDNKKGSSLYTFSLNLNDIIQLKILIDDFGFLRQYDDVQKDSSAMHIHSYYEIIFVVEGSVILTTPTKNFIINENDLCCIAPNELHRTHPSPYSSGCSCKRLSIMFSIQMKNKSKVDGKASLPMISPLIIRQDSEIKRIVEYLQQRLARFSQPYSEYEKNILSFIVSDLIFSAMKSSFQEVTSGDHVTSDATIATRKYLINQYISYHYDEDVSLEELSQKFFLSKKQIINTIKEMTGMTFRQYVIYLRLIRAENLIVNSDRGILEIARSVGYNSENGFYQAFKKMFGDTPEGYRRRVRSKGSN